MPLISQTIDWLEGHPVVGGAALGAAGVLLAQALKHWLTRRPSPYMNPTFYALGRRYFVTAVLEQVPADTPSGYSQTQHSRPEQWSKLITIRTGLFGLRHQIVPHDSNARLIVVIRRSRNAGEKLVRFNA